MFSIDASISVTTRFQTVWMDSDVLILVRWNCSASRLYSLFSFLMNSAECSGRSARILRSSASKTNETSGWGRTLKIVHVQMENPRHSPHYETKRVEQILVPYVREFSS